MRPRPHGELARRPRPRWPTTGWGKVTRAHGRWTESARSRPAHQEHAWGKNGPKWRNPLLDVVVRPVMIQSPAPKTPAGSSCTGHVDQDCTPTVSVREWQKEEWPVGHAPFPARLGHAQDGSMACRGHACPTRAQDCPLWRHLLSWRWCGMVDPWTRAWGQVSSEK